MKKFAPRPKTKPAVTRPCKYLVDPLQYTEMEPDTIHETNNNRTVGKRTEVELKEPKVSLTESDEMVHHIETIKNIEEKQKH